MEEDRAISGVALLLGNFRCPGRAGAKTPVCRMVPPAGVRGRGVHGDGATLFGYMPTGVRVVWKLVACAGGSTVGSGGAFVVGCLQVGSGLLMFTV